MVGEPEPVRIFDFRTTLGPQPQGYITFIKDEIPDSNYWFLPVPSHVILFLFFKVVQDSESSLPEIALGQKIYRTLSKLRAFRTLGSRSRQILYKTSQSMISEDRRQEVSFYLSSTVLAGLIDVRMPLKHHSHFWTCSTLFLPSRSMKNTPPPIPRVRQLPTIRSR